MTTTLAIETSCDDTSVGIIEYKNNHFYVKKLIAYSQIQDHQIYGGVVPEIASRLHSEKILEVFDSVGRDEIKKVDTISITSHPGLPGSLIVGKTAGEILGTYFDKPVVYVNHILGHIFSLFLERNLDDISLPLVVLTASGGHNDIYLLTTEKLSLGEKKEFEKIGKPYAVLDKFKLYKLGQTLDDAAGEAFDKVSRILGGPYPGGPWISKQAENHEINPGDGILFNRIWLSSDKFEFSFSGIKSQVHSYVTNLGHEVTEDEIKHIAYEFQESVVEVLAKKLIKAGIKYGAKSIGIVGGVSANKRLREYTDKIRQNIQRIKNNNQGQEHKMDLYKPQKIIYSTDNAAMIGVVGLLK